MSIINQSVIEIDPMVAFAWHDAGEAILVDVREDEEWNEAHIPGIRLAPMSEFDAVCFPRQPGKRLVIVCGIGKRSEAIARLLVRHGEAVVYNLTGGLAAWRAAGLPVVTSDFGFDPIDATPSDLLGRLVFGLSGFSMAAACKPSLSHAPSGV